MTSSIGSSSDPFQRFIVLSIVVHIGIFTLGALKTYVFPNDDIIIRNAIKVDLVALPEKKVQPIAQAPAPPKPAPVIKIAKVKKPKPKLKKKTNIDNSLKLQQEALRNLQQKMALENLQKQQNEAKKALKPKLNKGNIISSGGDFSGLDRIQFEEYFSQLKKHINDHWNLPEWLSQSQLKAQVQINIDERGYILKKEMVSTSGNDVYDNSLMSALEASSPLPQPPPRLRAQLSQSAIVLRFPGG